MGPGARAASLALVLAAVGAGAALAPVPAAGQAGDPAAGRAIYERKCLLCHGDKGDGKGPGADLLDPRPRDFTGAVYKFRSTGGKLPADQDIFRIITDGMPGTSMPPWSMLPEKDRWHLVAYLKSLAADKFKEGTKPLQLPKEVASSAESQKRGKEMFEAIECHKCHGNAGRADGPSRDELKDDWGQPVPPANLAKPWNFRGGMSRTDLATRIANGVVGTPMPAFLDSVEKPEDIWHLTNYVLSLSTGGVKYATLLRATAVSDAIPDDPAAEFWRKRPPQHVPLMGQVIVDPRNFNPAIDLVTVRAAWNAREVAFHLTWDDPTAPKTPGPATSQADPGKKRPADAVALQFPAKPLDGSERPYFLMGDASEGVYLLRWTEGEGVSEAVANGPGKVVPVTSPVASGKHVWADGRHTLVLKRPLAGDAGRPAFQPGIFTSVAVHAWDGGTGEIGTKMSLTSWYHLRLDEPESNRRFVLPPVVALGTLALMALVVRVAVRRGRERDV